MPFVTQDRGIAVITVNYGTSDLAIGAVESVLARNHGGRPVEIHLLDNASPGDDAARLSEAHSRRGWGARVTLWLETENHGFGRGNNIVLRALAKRPRPPEYVFLLNPDAALANEAIAILAEALDAAPAAAAAGAGNFLPDGAPAVACFRFPSLLREIVSAINFGPLDQLLPNARIPLPVQHPEGEVDWVAGASVLMRFDMIREVGFFDPDFFLYFEEVELMHRLAGAGRSTLYVPRARVMHVAGAATKIRSEDPVPKRQPAYLYQSWRLYYEKTHGRLYALAAAVLKLPAAWLGLALARLRRKASKQPAGFSRDHWRYVLRPLLTGSS